MDIAIPAAKRQSKPQEQGNAIVETAIVLLVFLTVLIAVADFSRALYAYQSTADLARRGTRFAVVHGAGSSPGNTVSPDQTQTETEQYIVNYATTSLPGIDPHADHLKPNVSFPDGGDNKAGCRVKVQVDYIFDFALRFGSVTISNSSQMVISY